MKSRLSLMSIIAAMLSSTLNAQPVQQTPTLITHVTVITMEENGEVLKDGSVLLRAGKIAGLFAPGTQPSSGALHVIDGHGGWLIPGLIDSHTHYGYDSELPSYLRFGVTTVLSLGDPENVIAALPAVSAKISAGTFPGPKVYATGPIIANHIKFTDPILARAFVREEAAKGYGFIKVYNGTTREIFDAVVDEAHKQHMGVLAICRSPFLPNMLFRMGSTYSRTWRSCSSPLRTGRAIKSSTR